MLTLLGGVFGSGVGFVQIQGYVTYLLGRFLDFVGQRFGYGNGNGYNDFL